ncbi:MAG: NIL domain-containing protein [Candidatus Poribacteria bacterium]
MPSKRVRLTFPGELITEPVIYNVARKYDVVTNIRRANVEGEAGWVVMEMSGSDEGLDDAVAYLREVGVDVEPVGGDVVAS